jgi:RimJ/RimL family protein N-acetyltransferase
MFPEIVRDDIFRLETERMWLRWPRPNDADAFVRHAGDAEVALMTAHIPHPYELAHAKTFTCAAREQNAAGSALHLVLTSKRQPNEAMGVVSTWDEGARRTLSLGYWLGRGFWGQGLMSEAVAAFVDLIFKITTADQIFCATRSSNERSRKLLHGVGFETVGTVIADAPARSEGKVEAINYALRRGKVHTVFGARRPRLLSS